MKILIVHNFHQQPGGEDEVFFLESKLLKEHGHHVMEYTENNECIKTMNPVRVAFNTIWSFASKERMSKLLNDFQPDLVHFHNTFPLISPSAYYACVEKKVPVVMTLHNARLICPVATLCRMGRPCEDCLHKTPPWPAILHKCYRGSYVQTTVIVMMLTFYRLLKTWKKHVDIYIASTEFYRKKFIDAGIPSDKIRVKPHFVEDGGIKKGPRGDYALFIGRFSPEKGILTLLKSWESLKDVPLKIRGDGDLLDEVKKTIMNKGLGDTIEIIGRLSKDRLYDLIKRARFLVVPSEGFYETFGLVVLDAFACGVPVIASRIGVMTEIVDDGRNGLHFTAGDESDLASKIKYLWTNFTEAEKMGRCARKDYEEKYSPERNYLLLNEIYESVVKA